MEGKIKERDRDREREDVIERVKEKCGESLENQEKRNGEQEDDEEKTRRKKCAKL